MIEYQKFNDYYNARIKETGEHVIHRSMDPFSTYTTLSPDKMPEFTETSEKVIGVFLPQSKYMELVYNSVDTIEDIEIRKRNPVVRELYEKYKMMLNLYK